MLFQVAALSTEFPFSQQIIQLESGAKLILYKKKQKTNSKNSNTCKKILFFHGLGSSIGISSFQKNLLKILNGYEIWCLEYNKIDANYESWLKDAKTALQDLKPNIVIGHSMGGAIAIHSLYDLLQEENLSRTKIKLILLNTFSKYDSVISNLFPLLSKIFPFRGNNIDSLMFITELKKRIKIIIMHSKEDTLIPFYHSQLLAGSGNKVYELLGNHNDIGSEKNLKKIESKIIS